jgi:hypothetical protein
MTGAGGPRVPDSSRLAAALFWCKEQPRGRLFVCCEVRPAEAAAKANFDVEARDLPVGEHDVGLPLDGGEVPLPEPAARLRRLEERADPGEQRLGVSGSRGLDRVQHLVYADDQFGDGAQPSELLMVDDKLEQFAACDLSVHPLVIGALVVEQRLVQSQQDAADVR